jgi:hypothetical protein
MSFPGRIASVFLMNNLVSEKSYVYYGGVPFSFVNYSMLYPVCLASRKDFETEKNLKNG